VIGSMTPDFGYYLPGFEPPWPTHSLIGSVLLCLPAGLLQLALFHALKRPVCLLLPQPHRAALTPLTGKRPEWQWRAIAIAAVSLLLGSWTHIAWDSLTHANGWCVEHLAWLRRPLPLPGQPLAVYAGLQHLSSVAGAAMLWQAYRRWLCRHRPARREQRREHARYAFLAALAILATAAAVPAAQRLSAAYQGPIAVRVFLFQLWVHAAAAGVVLLAAAGLVHSAWRALRRRPGSG
jgi:hypothetical protein